MLKPIQYKRGDTFTLKGVVKIDGVVQDISQWGIRSHVRKGATLVEELSVTKVEPASGVYSLTGGGNVSWPIGELTFDVEYTTPFGQIVSTQSIAIQCVQDRTI